MLTFVVSLFLLQTPAPGPAPSPAPGPIIVETVRQPPITREITMGDVVLGELLRDLHAHANLPARMRGELDARDTPDLYAGEPDGGAFLKPRDLGELRMNDVARLEEAGAGAEHIDDGEEHPE